MFAFQTHSPAKKRFIASGSFCALLTWLLRIPLSLVLPYGPAVFMAGCITLIIGFFLYRAFVFPRSSRPIVRQAGDFVLVNLGAKIATTAIAILLQQPALHLLGVRAASDAIVHGFAIGIGAVINYAGHKLVSFRA